MSAKSVQVNKMLPLLESKSNWLINKKYPSSIDWIPLCEILFSKQAHIQWREVVQMIKSCKLNLCLFSTLVGRDKYHTTEQD